ncbi:MAG: hypothetical protein Q7S74_02240 [Nanoarchaeota archaeon]|nr:hypothetical protein [Nanoarchaeota archaeon]
MLDQIQEYLTRPETPYVIPTATGILGLFIGRISVREKEKTAQRTYELKMAELHMKTIQANADITHAQYETAHAQNEVELTKLKYEENQKQHERNIQIKELDNKKENERREAKKEVLQILAEKLEPTVRTYTESLENTKGNGLDPELMKKRAEYRTELMNEFEEKLKEDYTISDVDYDIDEEGQARINRLVEAKYPVGRRNGTPAELEKLIANIKNQLTEI